MKSAGIAVGQDYHFTREQYHRMAKTGVLHEDDRVELIEGKIIVMSPIGKRHASVVTKLNNYFAVALKGRGLVSPQNPLLLRDESEPEPDLMLLKSEESFYAEQLPGPDDVLLLVEVADTSVDSDRALKVPLYAENGIAEVWLIDLESEVVEVFQNPEGSGFGSVRRLSKGERLAPAAFRDLSVEVGFLF